MHWPFAVSRKQIRGIDSGFARWLYDEGYTEHNLLAALKVPKPNSISMEPLSEAEISGLMSSFDLNLELGCRNAAMMWLFLDTGLRCAELVGLDM